MMTTLPPALAALAAYPQFCLYFTKPGKKNPAKADKFPCNYLGEIKDAHDRSIWMDAATALGWANHYGGTFGVAFVLADSDPFFFVDIDSCLQPDGTWSALALGLLGAFDGCGVEVSGSGRGLHILGTGTAPEHSCRRDDLGLEFYTSGRFIALTGVNTLGDVSASPHPGVLEWLVDNYFPLKGARAKDVDWSDGPCAEWNGPEDDADLLRRALNSTSAAHVFGNRASFSDLWTANAPVLAGCYPSDNDVWNGSAADQALANHLVFWTGKDCERVKRLMFQSALVRPKWERDQYIEDTILSAVAINKNVLQDKPLELPAIHSKLAAGEHVTMPTSQVKTGSTFASIDQQIEIFKGCVYVRDVHRVLVPGGELLRPDTFRSVYGGYSYVLGNDNGKVVTDAWVAFTQSLAINHPQVRSTCFRPDLTPGAIIHEGGNDLVNTYFPIEIPQTVGGDPAPFFTHLRKLLPDENDQQILLAYLAACVQHKGKKFQWAPLIQGVEGNGKTFFSYCAAYAIGERYTHWPKASQLGTQFNAWLDGKLLYCVEDVHIHKGRAEVFEELKPMITGTRMEIQQKGVDQITKDICGNFIFNSNHKGAVRKTMNDRRIAVMFSAQQELADFKRDGMDGRYMADLYDWAKGEGAFKHLGRNYGFSVVAELLNTWEIPDHLNPATSCQRAPQTSSTQDAIAEGRSLVEQYILEAVEEERTGFRGGWISSHYLTQMLDEQRLNLSPASRAETLKVMGYVPHPGLARGRVNNTTMPDAAKPILYILEGSEAMGITGAAEIARIYSSAQLTN